MNLDIKNIFISTYGKPNYLEFLNISNKAEISSILENSYNGIIKKVNGEIYKEYSKKALVEAESVYLSKGQIEEDFGETLNKIIADFEKEERKFEPIDLRKRKVSRGDKKMNPSMLIIELSDVKQLLFLRINSRGHIRNKNIIDLVRSGSRLEADHIYQLDMAIELPTEITGVYDFEEEKFYIENLANFEYIMNISEINKVKAIEQLEKFKSNEFKLAKEYTFSFEGYEEIQDRILASKRSIRRLSYYDDSVADLKIDKIKDAMNRLKEKERLEIDEADKKITVANTEENVKTFVAIIHNGIVERLLTGEVEII